MVLPLFSQLLCIIGVFALHGYAITTPPPGVFPPRPAKSNTSFHAQYDPLLHPTSHFYVNGAKPPGTLLLAMVIKDEADTLDRTLPRWAKLIDYWVIGVDDNNTDGSRSVINKHLGSIPGEILTGNIIFVVRKACGKKS
eukprot:gb/GECG01000931.1/.p1 GENE.gb/GECG01000931.1/~~gb/GECG01000931.1/.p1  ORF type:complete len:139 (+),score=8.12 gb/GECG01000931.1/:1-417(+)